MTITVLSAFDGRNQRADGTYYECNKSDTFLTKTIYGNGFKRQATNLRLYRLGDYYTPLTLEELDPILDKLENDPHSMAIRYKYKDRYRKGQLVLRNSEVVEAHPSPLVCIDIDELSMPNNIDKTDIDAQASYVVKILHSCYPSTFPSDLGYIAQGSSSAGFSDKIKLHFWFRNDKELTQEQLKGFFYKLNNTYKEVYDTEYNLVDLALYSRTQPHYLARPMFVNVDDPLEINRKSYFRGELSKITEVAATDFLHAKKVTKVEREKYLSMIEGSLVPSKVLESKLEKLASWRPNESGARTAVISAYHTAYQECFDFKELDKHMKKILDIIRPGKAEDYINQGKNAALSYGISNAERDLPEEVLGIKAETLKSNEGFYLKLDSLPNENTVLYLKASLGTGKTTNIVEHLKNYKGSFLTITNNTALVGANAARFGSGVYNKEVDMLDLASGKINKMSTTIHSLWKFRDYQFDFIFIDEADATLNDLVSASIINEAKRALIRDSLQDLFCNSKVVILSDGDISKETMEAYTSLMLGQKNIVKLVHEKENLAKGIAYKHKSIPSLLGAMHGALELGEKCILVTDLSPQKLNSFKKTLERVMPEKVGSVMHAHSKEDEDFVDIVNGTTKALQKRKVDYILASPSITNGVDFNYFDTIFVVTTTMSQTPNLRFQALKRERKSNKIHFYLGRLSSYTSGYALLPETTVWLENTRRILELRKERECANYTNTFIHYLIKAGCKVSVVDDAYESPQTKEDKELALQDRALAIYEGVSKPLNNDAPEMRKMLGFFNEDPDLEYIEQFLRNRTYEKAKLLATVISDFWYVLQHCCPQKLLAELSGEKGSLFNRLTGISLPPPTLSKLSKLKISQTILERCGLDDESSRDSALEAYKAYCRYEGVPIIPEILESNEEVASELSI
jgi:hypothetical protein